MDVDMPAEGDVRAGESDDLAVLADGFALGDGAHGDLVAEPDAAVGCDDGAVEGEFLTGQQHPGGDGDVVLRAEMDGDLGERHGWHEGDSASDESGREVTISQSGGVCKGGDGVDKITTTPRTQLAGEAP